MDPAGNVPLFLAALKPVAPERRRRVLVRELLIALGFLLLFLLAGPTILSVLGISQSSLAIAGGIILFLIALRMIFPIHRGRHEEDLTGEPFVVPLAVPFVAGPSALASVMLVMGEDPSRWPTWLAAVLMAWAATAIILVSSERLSSVLGTRGLIAIERLMGMVLTAIAVEMFMRGLSGFGVG